MMNKHILALAACLAAAATPVLATDFRVEEATIPEIEQAFRDHRLTCHQLVQTYFDRIAAYDKQGPKLNAILTLNGSALAAADLLDTSVAHGGKLGALHCVPVVLKDNYNTVDLPTTGGSLSLEGAQPDKDAFVVAQLRAAGAIILAKTNMHEFALSGTTVSSLGGQTLNPYDLTRTPGGSSGGTAASVASNLAMAGTGSDTVNSIRSPSSAAAMLQAMAAADPADPQTAGHPHPDYTAALNANALKGKRIGVLRVMFGSKPEHLEVNEVMERAISAMKQAGADLIDIDAPELDANQLIAQNDVQKYEFKAVMDRYLATIPNAPTKTVDSIYAGGRYDHPTLEGFLKSAVSSKDGLSEADYKARLDRDVKTRALVEKMMDDNHLDAVVYPLQKRLVVPVTELNQADRNGILASVTGFPAITVPAGFSAPTKTAPLGVPVGMDILGKPWSEAKLLWLAYSFEQATHFRRSPESAPPLPSEK